MDAERNVADEGRVVSSRTCHRGYCSADAFYKSGRFVLKNFKFTYFISPLIGSNWSYQVQNLLRFKIYSEHLVDLI